MKDQLNGLFFYYHMENHISVWHIDWTICVGVVALLTEYFNKMGGGEGRGNIYFFGQNQPLIIFYFCTVLN
jgi:hypothetical protein